MTRLQITCPHEVYRDHEDGSRTCLMCEMHIDDDDETAFAEGRTGYAFKVTP